MTAANIERLKAELQRLAAKKAWCDAEQFFVDDYAGGNINDAYYGGCNDGEIILARQLLDMWDVD
jgi:hypothetical protein